MATSSFNKPYISPTGVVTQALDGDNTETNFMRSAQNQLALGGAAATRQGSGAFGAGTNSLGDVIAHMSRLVNGDQADISQAIQPEANRIKDSFSAVRNMISQQPRGGGKAGVLAEAPYKERQQVQDTATAVRQNATGQLGNLSSTLAGLGLSEQGLGQSGTQAASGDILQEQQMDISNSGLNQAFKGISAAGQLMQGVGSLY